MATPSPGASPSAQFSADIAAINKVGALLDRSGALPTLDLTKLDSFSASNITSSTEAEVKDEFVKLYKSAEKIIEKETADRARFTSSRSLQELVTLAKEVRDALTASATPHMVNLANVDGTPGTRRIIDLDDPGLNWTQLTNVNKQDKYLALVEKDVESVTKDIRTDPYSAIGMKPNEVATLEWRDGTGFRVEPRDIERASENAVQTLFTRIEDIRNSPTYQALPKSERDRLDNEMNQAEATLESKRAALLDPVRKLAIDTSLRNKSGVFSAGSGHPVAVIEGFQVMDGSEGGVFSHFKIFGFTDSEAQYIIQHKMDGSDAALETAIIDRMRAKIVQLDKDFGAGLFNNADATSVAILKSFIQKYSSSESHELAEALRTDTQKQLELVQKNVARYLKELDDAKKVESCRVPEEDNTVPLAAGTILGGIQKAIRALRGKPKVTKFKNTEMEIPHEEFRIFGLKYNNLEDSGRDIENQYKTRKEFLDNKYVGLALEHGNIDITYGKPRTHASQEKNYDPVRVSAADLPGELTRLRTGWDNAYHAFNNSPNDYHERNYKRQVEVNFAKGSVEQISKKEELHQRYRAATSEAGRQWLNIVTALYEIPKKIARITSAIYYGSAVTFLGSAAGTVLCVGLGILGSPVAAPVGLACFFGAVLSGVVMRSVKGTHNWACEQCLKGFQFKQEAVQAQIEVIRKLINESINNHQDLLEGFLLLTDVALDYFEPVSGFGPNRRRQEMRREHIKFFHKRLIGTYGLNAHEGDRVHHGEDDTLMKVNYAKVQEVLAKGWLGIEAGEVDLVESVIKKVGIPTKKDPGPNDFIRGEEAWAYFKRMYGDPKKQQARINTAYPRSGFLGFYAKIKHARFANFYDFAHVEADLYGQGSIKFLTNIMAGYYQPGGLEYNSVVDRGKKEIGELFAKSLDTAGGKESVEGRLTQFAMKDDYEMYLHATHYQKPKSKE